MCDYTLPDCCKINLSTTSLLVPQLPYHYNQIAVVTSGIMINCVCEYIYMWTHRTCYRKETVLINSAAVKRFDYILVYSSSMVIL